MTRENAFNKSEVTKQDVTLSEQYDLSYRTNVFLEEKAEGNTSKRNHGYIRLHST